jgi:hypothetical protein
MRVAAWIAVVALLSGLGCGAEEGGGSAADGSRSPGPSPVAGARDTEPESGTVPPETANEDTADAESGFADAAQPDSVRPSGDIPPGSGRRAGSGRPARSDPPADPAPDSWARYRRVSGPEAEPRIDRLELVAGPGEGGVWLDQAAYAGSRRVIALSLLSPSTAVLGGGPVDAIRYVTHHEAGSIGWVDARTGEALLPGTGLAPLLPRGAGGDPWPPQLTFLGREFAREEPGDEPARLPHAPGRTVVLDPDVQIGTSRHIRDDGTGLHDTGGRPARDYRYVELTGADYRDMIGAGMNVFRVPVSHLPWVLDEPAFVLTLGGYREYPDLPFRGSYLGAVMYMDEPAARCYVAGDFAAEHDPARAAQGVIQRTRDWLASDEKYGSRHMAAKMSESGCDYGAIVQSGYPVWEAVPSAAWYQLEAGMSGYCWEARLDPARLARESRENLGVDFPADIDACIDFHVAILRGAARHFDRPWGVSQYGQSVAAAADRLFPRAYDAGATYFWLWTSDAGHHFPHARQLEVTKALRRHEAENPRGATARALTAAGARTAIVLPWGYGFDDYFFGAASRFRGGQLWGSRSMRLEDRNAAGTTHREVLAAAMREAVPLLERGEAYDVLFLRDDEPADGYEHVRRISMDARVSEGP